MQKEKLDIEVLRKMKLPVNEDPVLDRWKEFLHRLNNPKSEVNIGLIGKYIELKDAYKSIVEALTHAGAANNCKVNIVRIHSENINVKNLHEKLTGLNGILVAPGFGSRGVEGKIKAITYAREQKIPFLGICLGMQCAVIEFARNILHLKNAHSTEMKKKNPHPVIDLMENQKEISGMGGTMRLGSYPCTLKQGSRVYKMYGRKNIHERHRHRFEFNNSYLKDYEANGMIASGINEKDNLVEIVEIPDHPWFIGIQFHPEYRSTVAEPHPLFVGLVKAAKKHKKQE